MRVEIDTLLSSAENVVSQHGPEHSWKCLIDEHPVIVGTTGIGKVAAAMTVTSIHERFRPRLFVFTGVAGGIDPDLEIGDIVLGKRLIQHDTGVLGSNGLERYQPGHVPFFNPTDEYGYGASPEVISKVSAALPGFQPHAVMNRTPRVLWGTILTGDQFLDDAHTASALHEELGGSVVEMEGAAMAQAATHFDLDHLVVRSISDRAGDASIGDFEHFLEQVAGNSARLVRHLLPHL